MCHPHYYSSIINDLFYSWINVIFPFLIIFFTLVPCFFHLLFLATKTKFLVPLYIQQTCLYFMEVNLRDVYLVGSHVSWEKTKKTEKSYCLFYFIQIRRMCR